MRLLHLLRHAKADWKDKELADVDRPLNRRGVRAYKMMARPIRDAGCHFGHVFCSPARRAQETIEGIAEELPESEIDWATVDALYTFSASELRKWIVSLPTGHPGY